MVEFSTAIDFFIIAVHKAILCFKFYQYVLGKENRIDFGLMKN